MYKIDRGGGAVQKLFTRTDPVHLYIYCAYLGVCLFVFLYPINGRTA